LRSIFTPTVEWYFSENFEETNCCTRLVFPVANAPTMQIFFWVTDTPRLWSCCILYHLFGPSG
jgi:hypothetical protein